MLCETPVVQTAEEAERMRHLLENGCKLTVAEQYTRYPVNSALLRIIGSGVIGEAEYAFVSIAHEYHGAGLIRAFLGIGNDVKYEVIRREFKFATTETKNRYETFTDGRVGMKKRTVALFEFDNEKAAIYDFDSEQYHSTIRANMLKIQGRRGEIQGGAVRFLDEKNEPHIEQLEVKSRVVYRESDNPNMREICEIERILFRGEAVYEAPFGLCGLLM